MAITEARVQNNKIHATIFLNILLLYILHEYAKDYVLFAKVKSCFCIFGFSILLSLAPTGVLLGGGILLCTVLLGTAILLGITVLLATVLLGATLAILS